MAFLFFGFLLAGLGCGKQQETLYPVKGKVSLNNAPLKGGTITFVPDDAKGNKSKSSPTGMISQDGTYSLTTDGRSGAPAGWYKVTVSTDSPGMGMGGGATTPDPNKPQVAALGGGGPRVDPKYKDPARTTITKEVVASGAGADQYDVTVQ
jgi:hypothetical protein